jgi:hypothetical protein
LLTAAEVSMVLLTVVTHSTEPPLELVDRPQVVFAGSATDDHGLASVTVNERPAQISGDRFSSRLDFGKAGVFPLTVVASDQAGNTALARRTVVVSTDEPPRSREAARFTPEADGRSKSVVFTIAVPWNLVGIAARALEIQSLDGQVVRSWQDASPKAISYEWNGTDDQGRTCPPGMYVAVFTVRDFHGRLREMYQPILVEG